jgi:hypothetical protein
LPIRPYAFEAIDDAGDDTLPVTDPGWLVCAFNEGGGPAGKGGAPARFATDPTPKEGPLDMGAVVVATTADAGSLFTRDTARVRNPASFAFRKSPIACASDPLAVRVS